MRRCILWEWVFLHQRKHLHQATKLPTSILVRCMGCDRIQYAASQILKMFLKMSIPICRYFKNYDQRYQPDEMLPGISTATKPAVLIKILVPYYLGNMIHDISSLVSSYYNLILTPAYCRLLLWNLIQPIFVLHDQCAFRYGLWVCTLY